MKRLYVFMSVLLLIRVAAAQTYNTQLVPVGHSILSSSHGQHDYSQDSLATLVHTCWQEDDSLVFGLAQGSDPGLPNFIGVSGMELGLEYVRTTGDSVLVYQIAISGAYLLDPRISGGDTTASISQQLANFAADSLLSTQLNPTFVLWGGENDLLPYYNWSNQQYHNYLAFALDSIMCQMVAIAPQNKHVVIKPIQPPFAILTQAATVGSDTAKWVRLSMIAVIADSLAKVHNMTAVNTGVVSVPGLLSLAQDVLHPNKAGYQLIAKQIIAAVTNNSYQSLYIASNIWQDSVIGKYGGCILLACSEAIAAYQLNAQNINGFLTIEDLVITIVDSVVLDGQYIELWCKSAPDAFMYLGNTVTLANFTTTTIPFIAAAQQRSRLLAATGWQNVASDTMTVSTHSVYERYQPLQVNVKHEAGHIRTSVPVDNMILLSLSGQICRHANQTNVLNTQGLPAGVYVVCITSNNQRKAIKLIINP